MAGEWRFSDWDVHVFYVAFDENQENSRLKIYADGTSIPLWMETFRSGVPVVIHPAEPDKDFFSELVEQEFLRLARLEGNEQLNNLPPQSQI